MKKINLDPNHCSIRRYEGGFTWTFYGTPVNGSNKHEINIKFERWWLVYLAEDLKEVLKEEEEEIKRLRSLMFEEES